MKVNRSLVILLILVVLMGSIALINPLDRISAENDAEGKIAYVNIQSIFNSHPDKAAAEKKLNELAQSMQAELEEKAENLSKEEQQQLLQDYQENLSKREEKLIQSILTDIDNAINRVAEEKKVRMVLDKKNVVFGGYDLTQVVINYIEENVEEAEIDQQENQETAQENEEAENQ